MHRKRAVAVKMQHSRFYVRRYLLQTILRLINPSDKMLALNGLILLRIHFFLYLLCSFAAPSSVVRFMGRLIQIIRHVYVGSAVKMISFERNFRIKHAFTWQIHNFQQFYNSGHKLLFYKVSSANAYKSVVRPFTPSDRKIELTLVSIANEDKVFHCDFHAAIIVSADDWLFVRLHFAIRTITIK